MNSVVSYPERGNGGKSSYRGNCSPKLIEDIIKQYHLDMLSDYMVGSGTTEDVCNKLQIPGTYLDLNRGFDMIDMEIPERAGNIFWHPPYGDIIIYSDKMYTAKDVIRKYGFDPRKNDLSRCTEWSSFIKKMNYCLLKQYASLEKGGRMFVLMGDIKKKGQLYSMLCESAKPGTLEQIIIKMQHNCVSDYRTYSGNFLPIVHEYLMVLKKETALIYDVIIPKISQFDMRDSMQTTWRDVIAAIMEDCNRPMSLKELYTKIEGHQKTVSNTHWKEKIRQTLQSYSIFQHISSGIWALTPEYKEEYI